MYQLALLIDDVVVKLFLLSRATITMGRGTDNDIQIEDDGVSTKHACIRIVPSKLLRSLRHLLSVCGLCFGLLIHISVEAATYTLTVAGTGENAAATGDLDITDDIIINGAAVSPTIVDANGIDRMFDILGSGATISNGTIRNGNVVANGGGFALDATASLTLSASTVSGNTASGINDGGGIATDGGTADLTNVTRDMGAYKQEQDLAMPDLLMMKSATTLEYPYNGTTNPKAIAVAIKSYIVKVANTGSGPVEIDTVLIFDSIPANMALGVVDYDGANSGPIAFVDGSTASGLSYTFTSLGSSTDDVGFSNDDGSTWTYTPVDSGDGTDPAVTHIRVNPKGIFAGSTACADPSFQVLFKTVIQ